MLYQKLGFIHWFWEQSWWVVVKYFWQYLTSVFGSKHKCTKLFTCQSFLGWHRNLLRKYINSGSHWANSCQEFPLKRPVMTSLPVDIQQECLMLVDAVSSEGSCVWMLCRNQNSCTLSQWPAGHLTELFSLRQASCKRWQLLHPSSSCLCHLYILGSTFILVSSWLEVVYVERNTGSGISISLLII